LVARRALPSGGAKAQQCDQAITGTDPVTHSFLIKSLLTYCKM
jgi:hypothetical protein